MKNVTFVRTDADSDDWALEQAADDAPVSPKRKVPVDLAAIYNAVVISEALKADPFSLQSVENFLTGPGAVAAGITNGKEMDDTASADEDDQLAALPEDMDAYFNKKAQQPRQPLAGAPASQKVQGPQTGLETTLSDQERKDRRPFIA